MNAVGGGAEFQLGSRDACKMGGANDDHYANLNPQSIIKKSSYIPSSERKLLLNFMAAKTCCADRDPSN